MSPTYVYKVAKDRDVYMGWSTIVEAPVWIANRVGALTMPEVTKERLARADETGTSCTWTVEGYPVDGAWEDTGEIYMQRGILPRARFGDLADRLMSDSEADVSDLLEPLDGDGPSW